MRIYEKSSFNNFTCIITVTEDSHRSACLFARMREQRDKFAWFHGAFIIKLHRSMLNVQSPGHLIYIQKCHLILFSVHAF
jgi:hypothetical protein